MVQKFVYGTPFDTEALTVSFPAAKGNPLTGPSARNRDSVSLTAWIRMILFSVWARLTEG